MEKRILTIILAMGFMVTLAACKQKPNVPTPTPTLTITEEPTQNPTITEEPTPTPTEAPVQPPTELQTPTGTEAFAGESNGMRYEGDGKGNIRILEIITKEKNLVIPEEIAGHKVTEVGPVTGPCESITIPDTVTEIYGFDSLICLKNVKLSKNLVKIGEGGFKNLPYLESIVLPDSLTELCDELFYDSGVRSVMLPERLEKIGNNVFYRCQITEMVLPKTVKSIGDYAFNSCEELRRVELPEGLMSIGTNAFFLCTSLEYVALPNSLAYLGDTAFAYCDSLAEVTYRGVAYAKGQFAELQEAVNGNRK